MTYSSLTRFLNKIRDFLVPRRAPVRVRIIPQAEIMMHIQQRAAQRRRM